MLEQQGKWLRNHYFAFLVFIHIDANYVKWEQQFGNFLNFRYTPVHSFYLWLGYFCTCSTISIEWNANLLSARLTTNKVSLSSSDCVDCSRQSPRWGCTEHEIWNIATHLVNFAGTTALELMWQIFFKEKRPDISQLENQIKRFTWVW